MSDQSISSSEEKSLHEKTGSHEAEHLDDFNVDLSYPIRPNTFFDMEGNALSPMLSLDTEILTTGTPELGNGDPLFTSTQLSDASLFENPRQSSLDEHGRTSQYLLSHYGPFSFSVCIGEEQSSFNTVLSPSEVPASSEGSSWTPLDEVPVMEGAADAMPQPYNLTPLGERSSDESTEWGSIAPTLGLSGSEISLGSSAKFGPYSPVQEEFHFVSEDSQIRDFRELVTGLHGHWLQEIRSTPGLPFVKTTIYGLSSFEAGLRTLQQCFRGSLPSTLESILSLMQLAFACAYALRCNLLSHHWLDLFSDVLEWRHNIPAKEDRCLFVRIGCLLWAPKEGQPGLQLPSLIPQGAAISPNVPQLPCLAGAEGPSEMEIDQGAGSTSVQPGVSLSPIQDCSARGTQGFRTSSTGAVVKMCTQYLHSKWHPFHTEAMY